ncbi:Solute carrier family 2, facilitated glucose transporter member 2 [Hypsibius exemplaris]|uniref:Solute carrier family 2, facilitated glucose transporter member 2 n=1 Tax=Hypsibius exemplaris TaxID=2072580 RepID=A0A1W0WU86_HYPEX|nr:Solute carrier family 2, facilitated glucose transporter member 2 [Hypsibius exemplaris]
MGLWIRKVKCSRIGNNSADESWGQWCPELDTQDKQEHIKGTLLINNVSGIIAAALLLFPSLAGSYEMLIAGRFVAGLNAGLNSGVPPMYFTEISPSSLRGAIGSVHQLFITIAIFVSQILGEPKFLYLSKGDERGANDALVRLRKRTDIRDEMDEMKLEHEQMKNEPTGTFRDLFVNPFLRKITIIAVMLMVMQQLSGINAVMFYSTSIFRSAGLTPDQAAYATIGMGGINVLMTFVSVILVEKAGRKTLLLIGFSGMMITTVLLTVFMLLYKSGVVPDGENTQGWAAWASLSCVILFVIFFATGPVSRHQGVHFHHLRCPAGLFVTYTWFKVPETKGKRLEEIQAELRQNL